MLQPKRKRTYLVSTPERGWENSNLNPGVDEVSMELYMRFVKLIKLWTYIAVGTMNTRCTEIFSTWTINAVIKEVTPYAY